MFPLKDGYNFIRVNFGGYHLFKTLEEAIAHKMVPACDPGIVYTRVITSRITGKEIVTKDWFPVEA